MRRCDLCLCQWLKHPNDSSIYCAQCEWKVDEIKAEARREALEEAAKLVETYEGNAWTEEKETLFDRKAAAIRALAKEPKP